jgi:hypothetical protein
MSASDFSKVLASFNNPCSTAIPGGDPEALPPDPESCKHWIEAAYVVKAADLAIAEAIERGPLRDPWSKFIDDVCGTPPRWPFPWPPKKPFQRESLSAVQILAVAARFQEAADTLNPELELELEKAADRLFEVGLGRLAEQGPR